MRKKSSKKFSIFMVFVILFSMIIPNISSNLVKAATGPTDLIISEYVEGTSNNKAIELYNGTGQIINLTSYTLETYFNGSSTPTKLALPNFELANNSTYVIANSSSAAGLTSKANLTTSSAALTFNGDDAVVLKKGATVVDSIGQVGKDPGSTWGTTVKTENQTIVRKSNITTGDTTTTDTFDPALEWDGYPVDTFTNIGSHLMVITQPKAADVTSNVAEGAVPSGTAVTLSTTTSDATIYFTTNGSNPTTESTVYTSPIIIDQDTTIKAFAKSVSTDPSDIATYIYTIIDTTAPTAPVVNPVTNADQAITGTAEAGATVIAKVDGQEIGTAIVDTTGNFEIQIPRQNVGTIISIIAMDAAENISPVTEYKVIRANFKVTSVTLSVDKQSPQKIGIPVTIKATSVGSLEPEYRFFISQNGIITTLQEFSNSDTVTWSPSKTGTYKIIAHAKDKMTSNYEARTELSYVVNSGKVISVQVSTDLASPQVLGNPITLKATSIGSLDPEYRFFISQNGVITTLQEFSNSDTVTWIPSKTGSYKIIVHAKDKMTSKYEARTELTYEVKRGKVTSVQVSTDLASPQVLGNTITLKATSIGSIDPEYAFFISQSGVITTLQEFSNSDTVTWIPSKTGSFKIIVHAKDKMTSKYEARSELTYEVKRGKVASVQVSTDLASPQVLGNTITLKATSIGSLDPEYSFFVSQNGVITTLQEFSNNDTVTWTPSKSGSYKIIVHAKDKMTSKYEARTELTYKVNGGNVTSVQVSTDLTSPQFLENPITLKATSIGSLDPEYAFFVSQNGNITTLQEFSNNDTVIWTPLKTGTYKIIVHAKDKMTSKYEVRTEITFIIN
jgi:hypothetical protein